MPRPSKPIGRSPVKRRKPKPRPAALRDDAFLLWLRRQACCSCSTLNGRLHHAHHPRRGAGLALKAPDASAITLCMFCHHHLHSLNGPFTGWSRAKLQDWEAEQNARQRAEYERRAA